MNIGKTIAEYRTARYYYLKTTAEISAECKTGENHVRSMLSKIRKKLKKHIKELST